MKKTWIVLAMAAAFCVACDDSKPAEKCVENDAICDNGQRFICTNGEYVAIPCAANRVCSEGSCVTMPDSECLSGALSVPQCDSGNNAAVQNIRYCSNGLVKLEACPNNYVCSNAATGAFCVKTSNPTDLACTPNARRCSGQGVNAILQICQMNGTNAEWFDAANGCQAGEFCKDGNCVECDSSVKNVQCVDNGNGAVLAQHCNNGKWETVDTCVTAQNMVCRSGSCYDKFACNTEGAVQCGEGEVIQTCQSSKWVTTAVCSTAGADRCVDGKCVDSSVPQKGDSCNPKTFTDTCSDNKVVYCDTDDSTIVHYNCGSSTCAVITDSGETFGNCYDDTDVCTKEGVSSQVCMPYGSQIILASAVCTKANDGKLYKVAQKQTGTCASGCNADNTDCDENGQGTSSGASCDVFRCGDYECDEKGTSCDDLCKSQIGSNYIAVCDSSSAYCYARNEAKDSTCSEGETAYTASDQKTVQCLVVGSDEACLSGGSSGGGDSEYVDCGSDCEINGQSCSDYCSSSMSGSLPYCYTYNNQGYLGCGMSCSKEGQTGTACQEYSDGIFQNPTICSKIGSNLIMVDNIQSESDYKKCSNGCNAANTACK